jgi:hypothetical protein
MKVKFVGFIFGFLGFSISQAQPVKPTIYSPSNNAINVALQPDFSISLTTGLADSFLVELDSTATFNSVGKKSYKSYYNVCANCVKLPKIQLKMSQTWYVRARAWRAGLQGAWSNITKFSTASKALPTQNASSHFDFTAVMPEFMYSFSATNLQYEVSATSDFASPSLCGQMYPHDSFEGNQYTTMYVRLRGLPQNTTLYMRSRYFLRKDTATWGPTHTFALKYQPSMSGGGTVNTLIVAPSVSLAIYVYNNYTDTSVFYEYQRSSDSLFTNPTTFKTSEYFATLTLKSGTNFVRYRVVHRSLVTGWSNVVKYTTSTVLPAPILSSQGNAFRTAQANLGPNLSVIQWQADTSLQFNTARLIQWDSAYAPINANRYMPFKSDDFAKFRNCYLRYRTGNGTDWMSWSAPSAALFWQLQGSTLGQNFSLQQQFDFFPMNGVKGYYILCDVDSTFKTAKMFSVSSASTAMSVIVSDIYLDVTTVYYKIYARSAGGLSTPKTYKITNTIVPTIWGPGSGQSFAESVPYNIAGKAGSADLEFQVAKDAAFSQVVGTFITANGGNTGNLPVSSPGSYFFRVRYRNARSAGNWSTTVAFTITKVSEMAPPILRSPSNGSSNVDSKKTKFVWNQVPGATQYLISIFANGTGNLLYQNFTDSTWVWVEGLPANLQCQWSVLAMGDKASKKYSESWKFTTNAMVSAEEIQSKSASSIHVYPNPCIDQVSVFVPTTLGSNQVLKLMDANGSCLAILSASDDSQQAVRTMYDGAVRCSAVNMLAGSKELLLDVSKLSDGVYYLVGGVGTTKFVISR